MVSDPPDDPQTEPLAMPGDGVESSSNTDLAVAVFERKTDVDESALQVVPYLDPFASSMVTLQSPLDLSKFNPAGDPGDVGYRILAALLRYSRATGAGFTVDRTKYDVYASAAVDDQTRSRSDSDDPFIIAIALFLQRRGTLRPPANRPVETPGFVSSARVRTVHAATALTPDETEVHRHIPRRSTAR
jgi:hypothetical protein